MIGEPTVLAIRRNHDRPAAELLSRFRATPTCFVTDAQDGRGSLHHAIKPIDPAMSFHGAAVTASCAPGDNLAAMAALDVVRPGDVIVVAAGGDEHAAVVGDLWALWARRLGVAAVVVDGLVRDVPGLLEAGLPVFARGHCPNSGFRNGPGEINLGVTCGGVHVAPGDILVGDRDGVVVVPAARAEAVADRLDLVREKEAQSLARIRAGEKLQFWSEAAVAARGAVRYLD